MEINRTALVLAERAIEENLDSIEDLPREVANTVVNIYYKFFDMTEDMKDKKENPGWIPRKIKTEVANGKNMVDALKSWNHYFARVKSDFNAVNKMVEALREVDQEKQPRLYKYMSDFFIDVMKYDIPNAEKKTPIRRKMERKFYKKNVEEFPNLLDLL